MHDVARVDDTDHPMHLDLAFGRDRKLDELRAHRIVELDD